MSLNGGPWRRFLSLLSKAPQNKVTMNQERHSHMFLAGIQKKSLDARFRGRDDGNPDTHVGGSVLTDISKLSGAI